MAIQNEPTRIQIPFADSGTKNVIPDTNSTPSASQAASWTDGFPAQCSLPLSAGGIPPARADFNGLFNTLSQSARFTQEGGVWAWDATVDYGTNRLVLGSDGLLYWSVAQSGPNLGGAQDPTADTSHTYWVSPKVPTMPSADISNAVASTQFVTNWWTNIRCLPDQMYVDGVNGSDSNDGFTSSTPKKTITAVLSLLGNKSYSAPASCQVSIAYGDYSSEGLLNGVPGINLTLDFGNSGSVIRGLNANSATISVILCGTFTLSGGGLTSSYGSSIVIGKKYNPTSITINNYSGDAPLLSRAGGTFGAEWSMTSLSIAITGSFSATYGVMFVQSLAQMFLGFTGGGRPQWSGTNTGKKYSVENLGYLGGIGADSSIPGNGTSIGTTANISH